MASLCNSLPKPERYRRTGSADLASLWLSIRSTRVSGLISPPNPACRSLGYGNDHLLFDHKRLDPADEQGAVIVQPPSLRRGVGTLHRGGIVKPKLGDPIDGDLGGRDVGAGALVLNMVLHVTAHPRDGVRQRGVDLDPVLDEVV